jgi:Tfp pilus assembly PilM family ATPase
LNSLAIGFSGNSIRLVGITDDNKLSHISELETDFDFDREVLEHSADDHLISEIASVITGNINKIENIRDYRICLSVSPHQVFTNTIPLEMETGEQTISSNILWDLSMYYPSEYENFNINYCRLGRIYPEDDIYNVLVLGINKDILNFYKAVISECDMNLTLLDTDHLAVPEFIGKIYPDKNSFAALGLKAGRLDISLIKDNSLIYYSYASTGEFDFKTELDRELRELELKEEFLDINDIFIYGESLLESVKEYLEQKYPRINVDIPDPFKTYDPGEFSEGILHFSSSARFIPLFGIALKGQE